MKKIKLILTLGLLFGLVIVPSFNLIASQEGLTPGEDLTPPPGELPTAEDPNSDVVTPDEQLEIQTKVETFMSLPREEEIQQEIADLNARIQEIETRLATMTDLPQADVAEGELSTSDQIKLAEAQEDLDLKNNLIAQRDQLQVQLQDIQSTPPPTLVPIETSEQAIDRTATEFTGELIPAELPEV